MSFRKEMIEKAIEDIEADSCIDFEDVSGLMKEHLKGYDKMRPDYFKQRVPPSEYPDFLL